MKSEHSKLLSEIGKQSFELIATNRFLQDCALQGFEDDELKIPFGNLIDNPTMGDFIRNEGIVGIYDYQTQQGLIRYATALNDGRVYLLTFRKREETVSKNGDRLKKAWSLFVEAVSVYGGLK